MCMFHQSCTQSVFTFCACTVIECPPFYGQYGYKGGHMANMAIRLE